MKDENALKTIGEVSSILNVPAHVLRFWQRKFSEIKPIQKEKGRRYYSTDDIRILSEIKTLLYDKHFSVKGVQKELSNKKNKLGNIDLILEEMKSLRNKINVFISINS